jgi:hypothetical protein
MKLTVLSSDVPTLLTRRVTLLRQSVIGRHFPNLFQMPFSSTRGVYFSSFTTGPWPRTARVAFQPADRPWEVFARAKHEQPRRQH